MREIRVVNNLINNNRNLIYTEMVDSNFQNKQQKPKRSSMVLMPFGSKNRASGGYTGASFGTQPIVTKEPQGKNNPMNTYTYFEFRPSSAIRKREN